MSRYKTFFVQISKVGFLSILVVLLLASAVSYSLKNKKAENAYAGTGENVTGFAWSENIGWISFNNTSGGGGTNYGVNILEDASGVGKLSGYAWSENIGWISFNRSNTGAPPNNDVGGVYGVLAYIDSNNKLQGWARALAACDSVPCTTSGAGTNTGGWEGWVRLNDNNKYGITLNPAAGTSSFSGWAWGFDNIGWISSSNSTGGGSTPYKVSTNFELNKAPSLNAGTLAIESNANSYCGSGSILFKWTFSDPNFNSPQNQQSKYKIEASYNAGGPFYVVRETNQVVNNNDIVSVLVPLSEIKSDLGGVDWYGKDLYWKVTVWDNGVGNKQSTVSAIAPNAPYKLANNEYVLNFNSNPAFDKIYAEQDVQFFDLSKVYNSANPGGRDLNVDNVSSICGANCSRSWDFSSNGNPSTSALANPITTFAQSMSTTVSLKYTDKDRYSANYSCSTSQSVNVGLPIPKIEEKK